MKSPLPELPEITLLTRLDEDLHLTHLARLKFAIELEEIFDQEISDEVLEHFVFIGDVVAYFAGRHFQDVRPPVFAAAIRYLPRPARRNRA